MSNFETLNTLLSEANIAGVMKPLAFVSTPMGVSVDPDTFTGKAGLKPSIKSQPCGKGDCDCCNDSSEKEVITGDAYETVENKSPTVRYEFSGPIRNGADKELALGYHYTRFMSLVQRMVAPLPLTNSPRAIGLVASPALKKGLEALAKSEGLTMAVIKEGKKY